MSDLKETLGLILKEFPGRKPGRPLGTPTQSLTGSRLCRDCGMEKPDSEFYFTTTKSRDGSKSWTYAKPDCKVCHGKANKGRYLEDREYRKEYSRNYYKSNLRMADYWRAKSYAKKKGATLFMSVEEWEALRLQKNCYHCNVELSSGITNIEHIIPLCEGGQHTAENVSLSCANCNIKREIERRS